MRFLRLPLTIDKINSTWHAQCENYIIEEPFTDEVNGVLCVSCMSYIIALIFGQS